MGLVRPAYYRGFVEHYRGFVVRATREGRAGMAGSSVWSGAPDVLDVGVIILRPAHVLEVEVRSEAGATLGDARVLLEGQAQWRRCVVDRTKTDAAGRCRFER